MWNSLPNNLWEVDDFKEFRRLISHRASNQCVNLNLCFACSNFICFMLLVCFALLGFILVLFFNFALISSLLFAFKFLTYFYFSNTIFLLSN